MKHKTKVVTVRLNKLIAVYILIMEETTISGDMQEFTMSGGMQFLFYKTPGLLLEKIHVSLWKGLRNTLWSLSYNSP